MTLTIVRFVAVAIFISWFPGRFEMLIYSAVSLLPAHRERSR